MPPSPPRRRSAAARPVGDGLPDSHGAVSNDAGLQQAVRAQVLRSLPALSQALGGAVQLQPESDEVAMPLPQGLALDANSLLIWGLRPKVSLLCDDPYAAWLGEGAEMASSDAFIAVHHALCASRRVVAGTRRVRQRLQQFHSQYIEHRPLPPLEWLRPSDPSVLQGVLISAQSPYERVAEQVQARLQMRWPQAGPWRLALGESAQREVAEQALRTGGPASVRLHVVVGPASIEADQLRLHESWMAGIPVLQFMPRLVSGVTLSELNRVTHGGSGLLAHTFDELEAHAGLLISDPAYADFLRFRARTHVGRVAPSWLTYLQDVLGD